MEGYVALTVVLGCAFAVVGIAHLVHRRTAVAPDAVGASPAQSGERPREHALSRFHVRWYALTVVFLAFDVEMLFMYPWAVVVAAEGWAAVVEMFVFLVVLMAGVVWARREGAFRWS
ncbi:NADH-quinone oxidoreductase subunit A [Aquipuribacter nitratireducens]|uniref:NADH-quinone oxidoreductase subunit n=1 Tax=Aquipuribacter nitratireducens TaxID=650104 RepID=A0ABW0GMF2_9MICO